MPFLKPVMTVYLMMEWDVELIVKVSYLDGLVLLRQETLFHAFQFVMMDQLLEMKRVMKVIFKMDVIQNVLEFKKAGHVKEDLLPQQQSVCQSVEMA